MPDEKPRIDNSSEETAAPPSKRKQPMPKDEPVVFRTIDKIKSGLLSASLLDPETRQQCVEMMIIEGCSNPEIAAIFKISERTVARDMKAIRVRNAIPRNQVIREELMGELIRQAHICMGRMRKAAREKNARPEDKIEAERQAFDAQFRLTKFLEHIGYIAMPPLPKLPDFLFEDQ